MAAGDPAVAADRATVHLAEPAGLADAAPLGDVFHDRFGPPGRQPGVEQGRPLPLGEPRFAGAAVEHPTLLVRAVTSANRQVVDPASAMIVTLRIQATKAGKVLRHGDASSLR